MSHVPPVNKVRTWSCRCCACIWPYILLQEPCILTKEPYILTKEPCILSKEPYLLIKAPCLPATVATTWHITRATWHIHVWDLTHTYVRHDSFICVSWLLHTTTHSYVWHNFSNPRLIHMWDMTHTSVRHNLFTCVTWFAYTMTHSHEWHDLWISYEVATVSRID